MTSSEIPVSGGAAFLWQRFVSQAGAERDPGLNDALLVLLESYPDMCSQVCELSNPHEVENAARRALADGDHGSDLTQAAVMDAAGARAARRGADRVYERDVAAAILAMAGHVSRPECAPGLLSSQSRRTAEEAQSKISKDGPVRSEYATPLLDKLARNLTREASEGLLREIIGRDAETQTVVETLLRTSKRNPLLIGPAGVGKTAIIEGLALRVARGDVPNALQNASVFALQVTDLVQGMSHVGDIEERMKAIIHEAEQEGVVLFLDEIHAAVGAGTGSSGHNDLANILKPALARGNIACIGATTDGEYAQFITADPAFERRFQLLRVQEPPRTATTNILQERGRSSLAKYGVEVPDESVDAMISLAERYMRNRYMPDKALDVFDQTLARARLNSLKAITPDLVRDVVGAMVGIPVDDKIISLRLDNLRQVLVDRGGCQPDDAARIAQRLQVTMRGMDVRPQRPDVIILASSDHHDPAMFARALADGIFGPDAPLIEMDMSTFVHPTDVNWFVGAPPGYLGHDETPPMHLQLSQRPWSVVVFKRPDLAHEAVQLALATVLRDGFLKDSKGHRVHLSDAVVVLTAVSERRGRSRGVGFEREDSAALSDSAVSAQPTQLLAAELAACVDLSCRVSACTAVTEEWVMGCLLEPLARRWAESRNVSVEWDVTVAARIVGIAARSRIDRIGVERLFEDEVAPAIVAVSASIPPGARVSVHVQDERVIASRVDDV